MKNLLKLALISFVFLFLACIPSYSLPICENGYYSYTDYTGYFDDWPGGGFVPNIGGGGPIVFGDAGWGSFLDSTYVEMDCPDPCTYKTTVSSSFLGGNQWEYGFGGATPAAFSSVVSAGDGFTLGVSGSSLYVFNAFGYTWTNMPVTNPMPMNSIVSMSTDLTFGIYNGTLYQLVLPLPGPYPDTTASWVYVAPAVGISNISINRIGTIFGLNSSLQVVYFNPSTNTWAYYGPALPGMVTSTLTVGYRDWTAVDYGYGAFVMALTGSGSGSKLYLLDSSYGAIKWVQIPTPNFYPAEVKNGDNITLVRSTTGNIYRLDAMVWAGPNLWTPTWTSLGSMPSGTTNLASPGASDVFAFGPTSVNRFYANQSITAMNRVLNLDMSVGTMPTNLPNGSSFTASGDMTVTELCPNTIPINLFQTHGSWNFGMAYTKSKWTVGTLKLNCHKVVGAAVQACNFDLQPWCSNTDYPLYWNPMYVEDWDKPVYPGNDGRYWETKGICIRYSPGSDWHCGGPGGAAAAITGFFGYTKGVPDAIETNNPLKDYCYGPGESRWNQH